MNRPGLIAAIATLGLLLACSGAPEKAESAEDVAAPELALPAAGGEAAPGEPAVFDQEGHGHSHDDGEGGEAELR